jgi:hypothetical protein
MKGRIVECGLLNCELSVRAESRTSEGFYRKGRKVLRRGTQSFMYDQKERKKKKSIRLLYSKFIVFKIKHPFIAARQPENIWSRQGVNAFLLKNQEM